MRGYLITPSLDIKNIESEDGITWRVIPDECITDSSMGDSGGINNRSDNISDSSAASQQQSQFGDEPNAE